MTQDAASSRTLVRAVCGHPRGRGRTGILAGLAAVSLAGGAAAAPRSNTLEATHKLALAPRSFAAAWDSVQERYLVADPGGIRSVATGSATVTRLALDPGIGSDLRCLVPTGFVLWIGRPDGLLAVGKEGRPVLKHLTTPVVPGHLALDTADSSLVLAADRGTTLYRGDPGSGTWTPVPWSGGTIVGLAAAPAGTWVVSAPQDQRKWAVWILAAGDRLERIAEFPGGPPSAVGAHPDGVLVAEGEGDRLLLIRSDGRIRVLVRGIVRVSALGAGDDQTLMAIEHDSGRGHRFRPKVEFELVPTDPLGSAGMPTEPATGPSSGPSAVVVTGTTSP